MSGMSYDWNAIGNTAEGLNGVLTKFNTAIEGIFSEVAAMGESWSGASYEAFRTYCENYRKDTITPLSNEIGGWVNKLPNLSSSAQATTQNNQGLFGGGQ